MRASSKLFTSSAVWLGFPYAFPNTYNFPQLLSDIGIINLFYKISAGDYVQVFTLFCKFSPQGVQFFPAFLLF